MTTEIHQANGEIRLEITVDTSRFTATVERARESFEKFLAQVLANPEACAAFYRAQRAHPARMPALGAAYTRRLRRRTGSK